MSLIPDTFAAIAGQVLSAELLPYSSPVAGAPLLAVPSGPLWLGEYTVEYVTYYAATHSVTVQTSVGEYDRDSDGDSQLSRVLSAACKRMESALAALA